MTRPKPRGRWRRRLAVAALSLAALLMASPFGVRWWHVSQAERTYATAVAEADADDPNWRWDDLNAARPRPPVGENGMDVIAVFQPLAPTNSWGSQIHADLEPHTPHVPPNARHHDCVYEELDKELKLHGPALATARQLKNFSRGHHTFAITPNYVSTRSDRADCSSVAARMLRWSAERAAGRGDYTQAAADVLASLNAGRVIGNTPLLNAQQLRVGSRVGAVNTLERVLGRGEVVLGTLAELQAAFVAEAEEPLLLYALKGERAGLDVLMDNAMSGAVPVTQAIGSLPDHYQRLGPVVGPWMAREEVPAARAGVLRTLTRWVKVVRRPMHEQPAAYMAAENGAWRGTPLNPHLHRPTWFWRSAALARCAAVGVACERFRQHFGRWPASLPDLVPAFLQQVPLDPFDGNPLRYRRVGCGAVVYSIDEDCADNGGTPSPYSFGITGSDIVFRLYNVGWRDLPPPPPVAPEPRKVILPKVTP